MTQAKLKPVWPFVLLAIAAVPTIFVATAVLVKATETGTGYPLALDLLLIGLGLGLLAFLLVFSIRSARERSRHNSKLRNDLHAAAPATPIGHTPDGQPIYPVVGYTPDGKPVTADRAVGVQPTAATGTNSMAIVALVTGLTIAPLGVIFGHIALSQIKRTGQGGKGLAIAGLVLGYVGLMSWIILIAVAGANGAF